MYPFRDFQSLTIQPKEVDLLQRVLDTELMRRNLKSDSEEAEMLAKRLITLYQSGVRHPIDLLERVGRR